MPPMDPDTDTLKCKICEKDVLNNKLALHSPKCTEVTKLEQTISELIDKMQNYSDQAASFKRSLITETTLQQYYYLLLFSTHPQRNSYEKNQNKNGHLTSDNLLNALNPSSESQSPLVSLES